MTRLSAGSLSIRNTYTGKAGVVLPAVERHVLRKAKETSADRLQTVLHPSAMSKSSWCPRSDFYQIIDAKRGTGVEQEGPGSLRMANVYDYGHYSHRKWQQWIRELDMLWGRWACGCRDEVGRVPVEPRCSSCGKKIRYREVPLSYRAVGGHADGVIVVEDGEGGEDWYLLEIKTVGLNSLRYDSRQLYNTFVTESLSVEEVWFRIRQPFPAHIRQAMFYAWLARQVYPELPIENILFLYEWKPTQEVKEFRVKYNESYIEHMISGQDEVFQGLETGVVPDRPEWAETVASSGCVECPSRERCWGIEEVSNETDSGATPIVTVNRSRSSAARKARKSFVG